MLNSIGVLVLFFPYPKLTSFAVAFLSHIQLLRFFLIYFCFDSPLETKPTSWEGFWPETGSPQVTPWDMLVETADRYQVINAIISPQSWAKAASNCMQCSAKLITFGKHHCRNCGRTVCSKCSPGCLSHKFFPRKTFRNVKVSKTKRGGIRVCLECEGMLRARKGQEQSHSSLSLSSRSEFSSVFAPSLSSQYGAGCSSWEEESVCSPFQHVGDDSLSHHGQLSPSPTSAQENLTASPRQNTELLLSAACHTRWSVHP